MSYFEDFYPRLYVFLLVGGWSAYFIMLIIFASIAIVSESKYKNEMMYYFIIVIIIGLLFGVILNVFLPSPTYLGI